MKVVVAQRGQMTIPKDLREQIGITSGTVMEFREENGRLVGEIVAQMDPVTAVTGCLALDTPTDQILTEMRGE